jgi:Cytosol aminopeptidase family, N-terminal domain
VDLSFYPLTLEAIDQADADSLCLFVGEDERPLTGLAGLADWRLAGGLSRLLRKGVVKGFVGEALLTPGSRLGFRKLFLFGLGPAQQSEEALASHVAESLRRLQAAGVENAAMQLPSRLSLDLGIRTLIDEPLAPARALVFGPDPAALVSALSQAATRGLMDAKHERRVIKVPGPPRPGPTGRVGPPPKAPPLEVPKASPLPFAPSSARGPGANGGNGGSAGSGTAAGSGSAVNGAAPGPGSVAPAAPAASPPGVEGSAAAKLASTEAAPAAPSTLAEPAAPAATARPAAARAPLPPEIATAPLALALPPATPALQLGSAAGPLAMLPQKTAPWPEAHDVDAAIPTAPPAAPSQPPSGPGAEAEVPVAPHVPDSIPPLATAGPSSAQPPAAPPATPASPTAPAIVVRPNDGKTPLPIDHKAPRFKPPEPRDHGKGKKKRR